MDLITKRLIGLQYSDFNYTLTHDQAILYALATGSLDNSISPIENNLKFIYERPDSFQVFPTMAAAVSIKDLDAFFECPEVKELCGGLNVPEILLHGEEDLESMKPLEAGREYRIQSKIVDVIDKGKMTVVVMQKDMSSGEQIYQRVTTRYVLRGVGGHGYKGGNVPPLALPKAPDTEPDEVIDEIKLLPNQNALYRLTGDKNLIHIDPDVAKKAGFDRPIMHGLFTYGISARAVFERLMRNQQIQDVSNIARIGARFTSHVFPGETLAVKLWSLGPSSVYYETIVKNRGTTALKGFMNYRAPISGGSSPLSTGSGIRSRVAGFARML